MAANLPLRYPTRLPRWNAVISRFLSRSLSVAEIPGMLYGSFLALATGQFVEPMTHGRCIGFTCASQGSVGDIDGPSSSSSESWMSGVRDVLLSGWMWSDLGCLSWVMFISVPVGIAAVCGTGSGALVPGSAISWLLGVVSVSAVGAASCWPG